MPHSDTCGLGEMILALLVGLKVVSSKEGREEAENFLTRFCKPRLEAQAEHTRSSRMGPSQGVQCGGRVLGHPRLEAVARESSPTGYYKRLGYGSGSWTKVPLVLFKTALATNAQ